jgi:hypothetical protein
MKTIWPGGLGDLSGVVQFPISDGIAAGRSTRFQDELHAVARNSLPEFYCAIQFHDLDGRLNPAQADLMAVLDDVERCRAPAALRPQAEGGGRAAKAGLSLLLRPAKRGCR